MGALKLSYYNRQRALEVNSLFLVKGLEKNALLEKNRVSSSTYGFNGKEKDDEMKGGGNSYDYGFRIYDPRLGRFLSVDPITRSFPMLTPYQFASNTPIWAIDIDGLEASKVTTVDPETGRTLVTITIDIQVKNSSKLTSDQDAIKFAGNIGAQLKKTFSGEAGENTDVAVKVNITNLTVADNGQVVLDDFEEKDAFFIEFVDETDAKDPSDKGGRTKEIGNTQVNRFQVRVKSFTDPTLKRGDKSITRTGTHEVGHGLGLFHPFSKNNDVKDIKQFNQTPGPGVDAGTIRSNILNSGSNPNEKLRPTSNRATKSTSGQRKKIIQAVPESKQ